MVELHTTFIFPFEECKNENLNVKSIFFVERQNELPVTKIQVILINPWTGSQKSFQLISFN